MKSHHFGFGLGPMFWSNPELKYEATSIGDIKFGCRSYGGKVSFLIFQKTTLLRQNMLLQGEYGVSWIHEEGHKNMRLQGYRSTAESELNGIGVGISIILNYLKAWRIWLGSGFEANFGCLREHFNLHLHRDGYNIDVFDPKPTTSYGGNAGVIVLSAKILDSFWSAWDVNFGYNRISSQRDNIYRHSGHEDNTAGTEVAGWYFQIRKLYLLDIKKNRKAESKAKKH